MGPDEDCWVIGEMGDQKVENYILAPGEGVYLQVGTEGAKMVIPSPL